MTYHISDRSQPKIGRRTAGAAGAAAVAVLLLLAAPLHSPAAGISLQSYKYPPDLKFEVLSTPHFRILFHQGGEALARRAAATAESVAEELHRDLGWTPGEPTWLVISDSSDLANGYALVGGHNKIEIFPVHPEEGSDLENYSDWLRELIAHEYTHIVHLDMRAHRSDRLIGIFGRPVVPLPGFFPNVFQPLWLIEGLATYEETALSGGGRASGSRFAMYERAAFLEGDAPGVDRGSGPLAAWPGGTYPYLYGVSFYRYLAETYGPDKTADFCHRYSSQLLPFRLNRAFRQTFGRSGLELWDDWRQARDAEFTELRREIEVRGSTRMRPLTARGFDCGNPRWSPDGDRIYYRQRGPHDWPTIRSMRPDGEDDREEVEVNYRGDFDLLPDGGGMIFSQLQYRRSYRLIYDLYRLDFENGSVRRLTRGLRAAGPSVSTDGGRVAFVIRGSEGDRLAIMSLEDGEYRVLPADTGFVSFGRPRWSPDGRRLAVSAFADGRRDIYLVDPETGRAEALTGDRTVDNEPVFSPDGRWLLFSSDRTGIFNLFALDLGDRSLYRVTDLLGGGFDPAVSPAGDQLAFVTYSSAGYDLSRMPYDPAGWHRVARSDDSPDDGSPQETPTIAAPPLPSKPYRSLSTFWPTFWLPWLNLSETGSELGLFTAGTDILFRHRLLAAAAWQIDSGTPVARLTYYNDRYRPTGTVSLAQSVSAYGPLRGADGRGGYYYRRHRSAELELLLPWRRYKSWTAAALRFQAEAISGIGPFDFPDYRPPDSGWLVGPEVGFVRSSARRYGFSISPEEGGTVQVSLLWQPPRLGGDFDRRTAVMAVRRYLRSPLGEHHALALRLALGLAAGTYLRDRYFSLGGYSSEGEYSLAGETGGVFSLRGYPAGFRRGDRAMLLSAEYRLPLAYPQRGFRLWPVFLDRLSLRLAADAGTVWNGPELAGGPFDFGVAGELVCESVVGYGLRFDLRAGAARGLSGDRGGVRYYLGSAVDL